MSGQDSHPKIRDMMPGVGFRPVHQQLISGSPDPRRIATGEAQPPIVKGAHDGRADAVSIILGCLDDRTTDLSRLGETMDCHRDLVAVDAGC